MDEQKSSVELDENQRQAAAVFQYELGLAMARYLSAAICQAHEHYGITPAAFWKDLFLRTGFSRKNKPAYIKETSRDCSPDNVPPDPYKTLDFQACNKYLRYGGNRRAGDTGDFVKDSLLCLDYYGIPHDSRDPIGEYRKILESCVFIRNQFSHTDTLRLENIQRQELDESIASMKALTRPMLEKHNGWEKKAGLPETLASFWRAQDKRYAREFGSAPIPLDELGHELFFSGEEDLTADQQKALEQAVEYFNLKVVGGKVYQRLGRRELLDKLRSAPSLAVLLHTPAAATPEDADQIAEEFRRPDADDLPVLEQLEQPLWEPLDRSAAGVLQRAGTSLMTISETEVNALLDSFVLMVDESILLSAEGRSLLTERLAPALMKRKEKFLIDESVVSRLFRDFRSSVPYTPLELSEMGVDQALARELQAERRNTHTQNKTAIKALGFLRKRGCLEIAASPTNSEYSFENIYRVVEQYPKRRFLVLTTDRELARELKDVYGRNAVAAKPTPGGQLLFFRSTAPVYRSLLETAGTPEPAAEAQTVHKTLLSLKIRSGSGDRVAAEWPDGTRSILRLGKLAGEGGEGQVYHTSAPDGAVAKLYFPQQLTQERRTKWPTCSSGTPKFPASAGPRRCSGMSSGTGWASSCPGAGAASCT